MDTYYFVHNSLYSSWMKLSNHSIIWFRFTPAPRSPNLIHIQVPNVLAGYTYSRRHYITPSPKYSYTVRMNDCMYTNTLVYILRVKKYDFYKVHLTAIYADPSVYIRSVWQLFCNFRNLFPQFLTKRVSIKTRTLRDDWKKYSNVRSSV